MRLRRRAPALISLLTRRLRSETGALIAPEAHLRQRKPVGAPLKLANLASRTQTCTQTVMVRRDVAVIIYYTVMSSMMLIVNKVIVNQIPQPFFILASQMIFASCILQISSCMKIVSLESLPRQYRFHFVLLVFGFIGTIYCNIKTLQYSNVETFITFRSSTPILISFIDFSLLGRQFISLRSFTSLIVMLVASIGYVHFDSAYDVRAYAWLGGWYVFYMFDVVYIKHICNVVKINDWSRVYYTNYMSFFPLFLLFIAFETRSFLSDITAEGWILLVVSCIWGLGMSHATYVLRSTISATSFTVVGIMCKFFSVVVNVLIWEKHASNAGIGCLMLCLLGGSFYKQAPLKSVLP